MTDGSFTSRPHLLSLLASEGVADPGSPEVHLRLGEDEEEEERFWLAGWLMGHISTGLTC